MAINWSLLGEPVDIGAKFQEGYDRTEAKMKAAATERAFTAYANDPTNPETIGALARLSPQFAATVAQQKLAEAQRLGEVERRRGYFQMPDRKAAMQEAYINGDTATAEYISKLGDEDKSKLRAMYGAMAKIAAGAKGRPYEQRKPYIMANADLLRANGVSDEMLNAFDPTDDKLDGLIRDSLTVQQQLPDRTSVQPGGSVYEFDPVTNAGRVVVQQNPGYGAPAANIPPPPPGFTVDGGPTPPASGNFP